MNNKNTSLINEPNSSLFNQYMNNNKSKGHSTERTDFEISEFVNISYRNNNNIHDSNITNDGPVYTVGNSNRGRFNFLKFKIKNDIPKKVPLIKNNKEKKFNGKKKY